MYSSHNIIEKCFQNIEYGKINELEDDLKKGANVNMENPMGLTLLHLAVSIGNEAIIKLLFSYGADVDAKDHYGCTALHIAVENKLITIVELLLKHKADANLQDNHGARVLDIAIFYPCLSSGCHKEIVKLLLKYDADPFLLTSAVMRTIDDLEMKLIVINHMISSVNKILDLPCDTTNYSPILKPIKQKNINGKCNLICSTMISLCNPNGLKTIKLNLLSNFEHFFYHKLCNSISTDNQNYKLFNFISTKNKKLPDTSIAIPDTADRDFDSLYIKSLRRLSGGFYRAADQKKILRYLRKSIEQPRNDHNNIKQAFKFYSSCNYIKVVMNQVDKNCDKINNEKRFFRAQQITSPFSEIMESRALIRVL